MEKKNGFLKMNLDEFHSWLLDQRVARTVVYIQQHHTYEPDYDRFTGNNHFDLQQGMKNYHVNERGWRDIGQHFTIFPDGTIMTGRNLDYSPACVYGINSHSVCIENLGNFDNSGDSMNEAQRKSILEVTASLSIKFNIPVNTDKIIYHHWFNLATGERNNGTGNNKSCPGTNFFGGNKVSDSRNNFIPLLVPVAERLASDRIEAKLLKYVYVTASRLNVREGAGTNFRKAIDKKPVDEGTVLRVFDEQENWQKISNSKDHWVYARYTSKVNKAVVNVEALNVRKRPGIEYTVVGKLLAGQDVFIYEKEGDWCRVSNGEKWVHGEYLQISQ